jgi:hypothetical protein
VNDGQNSPGRRGIRASKLRGGKTSTNHNKKRTLDPDVPIAYYKLGSKRLHKCVDVVLGRRVVDSSSDMDTDEEYLTGCWPATVLRDGTSLTSSSSDDDCEPQATSDSVPRTLFGAAITEEEACCKLVNAIDAVVCPHCGFEKEEYDEQCWNEACPACPVHQWTAGSDPVVAAQPDAQTGSGSPTPLHSSPLDQEDGNVGVSTRHAKAAAAKSSQLAGFCSTFDGEVVEDVSTILNKPFTGISRYALHYNIAASSRRRKRCGVLVVCTSWAVFRGFSCGALGV